MLNNQCTRGRKIGTGRPRGRPRSKSAPAAIPVNKIIPQQKRKQWTMEAMEAAMNRVKNGELSVLRAATLYGIPKSTLYDRVSGKVTHGDNPGPRPYFSMIEEKEIANFLVDVAKAGYGKKRHEVLSIAGKAAHDKGKPVQSSNMLTHGWFRRFLQRQPQLSYRRGDPTANVRMDCLNKQAIKDYFDLLKQELIANNLMDSPSRIYNVDETGMCLDGHAPRVVALKGQKKVRCRTSGNKSQVTVIACVSATGQVIPPFVIFDAKRLNLEWRKDEVVGTSYGLSDNGWVDSELFKGWLDEHFIVNAVGARPILLLLDGHSSHFQPDLIEYARKYGIIMLCLPPHTTHESQPLDVSVFKSLKHHWQVACHNFIQTNPNLVITKFHFSGLLNQAWGKAMTSSIICAGFRKCGVYPFNPNAIDCSISVTNPESFDETGDDKETEEVSDENNPQMVNGAHDKTEPLNSVKHNDETECHSVISEKEPDKQWPADKILLFQRRYEEGYDVPDEEYIQWLHETHPDVDNIVGNDISLADYFSDLPIASPVTLAEMPTEIIDEVFPIETLSSEMPSIQTECDITPADKGESVGCSNITQSTGTPVELEHDKGPNNGASMKITQNKTSTGIDSQGGKNEGELRYISKYLVQFVPDAKPKNKETAVRISGARVLTSDKCASILKEREEKKQKEKEEKEKRKLLRDQKKKQREEELMKKKATIAERKATIAEKRAAAAERKKATAEKKAAAAEKKAAAEKRSAPVVRRATTAGKSVSDAIENAEISTESEESRKRPGSSYVLRAKRPRCEVVQDCDEPSSSAASSVSGNTRENDKTVWQCSICFEQYYEEDDEDWVQCGCGRWTHESCISDVVMDASGKELFCPYCSV